MSENYGTYLFKLQWRRWEKKIPSLDTPSLTEDWSSCISKTQKTQRSCNTLSNITLFLFQNKVDKVTCFLAPYHSITIGQYHCALSFSLVASKRKRWQRQGHDNLALLFHRKEPYCIVMLMYIPLLWPATWYQELLQGPPQLLGPHTWHWVWDA